MRRSPLNLLRPARREVLGIVASALTGPAMAETRRPNLAAVPGKASTPSPPAYIVHDARPEPDGRAVVAVRRDGPSPYSCVLRFTIDGGGLPGAGEFVFDHDVDEVRIPVTLPEPGAVSTVRILPFRTWDFTPSLTRGEARVAAEATPPPPLSAGASARVWDAPKRRSVPTAWACDFHSDLVRDFVCTATGRDAQGRPCFINSLAHGRAQFNNGEVGLYSDPGLHGTAPLQLLKGRRLLVPERLPQPLVLSQGGRTKRCTHASPVVTTEHNARLGYGRFSYRFALLGMQQGCWPAGWQCCLPHWRWPSCEQDTVEISFNRPDMNVFPYQTNWWGVPGRGAKEGQFANVATLLPGFRYEDFHTYWSEWTPERMAFGIDDMLTFSVPNRFYLADPANPTDPNRLYMILQVALGGAGGDVDNGTYPVAPSRWAPGAPAMLVDHIAHHAMPLN